VDEGWWGVRRERKKGKSGVRRKKKRRLFDVMGWG
jgi:hypothetical protein